MSRECPRELDVVTAARNWDLADPELAGHVASCSVCSDLLEVARAIVEDRRTLVSEARLQPAAAVYWRSQLRARREAAQSATRPIAAFQALAAASLIGVAVALAGLLSPGFRQWLVLGWNEWGWNAWSAAALLSGSPLVALVVVVAAAAVLSVPLAVYMILSDR